MQSDVTLSEEKNLLGLCMAVVLKESEVDDAILTAIIWRTGMRSRWSAFFGYTEGYGV